MPQLIVLLQMRHKRGGEARRKKEEEEDARTKCIMRNKNDWWEKSKNEDWQNEQLKVRRGEEEQV